MKLKSTILNERKQQSGLHTLSFHLYEILDKVKL